MRLKYLLGTLTAIRHTLTAIYAPDLAHIATTTTMVGNIILYWSNGRVATPTGKAQLASDPCVEGPIAEAAVCNARRGLTRSPEIVLSN